MQLQTERLSIRPFQDSDADAMIRLLMNPDIAKTYMVPELDEAAALRLFARFKALSEDAERAVAGLFDGGRLIGFVNDVERSGAEIEMGYVIDPAYHNQGYATEALTAVIAALLARGYDAVVCGAFEENAASLRVMEKAGMRPSDREEIIEYRGKKHRCVYRKASRGV